MKITQGFVAVTPDGEYIQWWQRSTHTGYRTEFGTTTKIDEAGVSSTPKLRRADGMLQHTWVPVELRVEVVLKGYGVKP